MVDTLTGHSPLAIVVLYSNNNNTPFKTETIKYTSTYIILAISGSSTISGVVDT